MASTEPAASLSPLEELRHVPGVLGALLVGEEGELLLESLPGSLRALAADAAPRLAVLLEALAAGRDVRGFCLRFAEHRLHVLPVSAGFLCVLSELTSSSPVLKMALNVTGRRL